MSINTQVIIINECNSFNYSAKSVDTKMKILIAGGGTMGRELITALPEHEVTLIESNPLKAQAISEDFKDMQSLTIVGGNASKRYVLKEADFDSQDVVVAVTHDDQVNLFLSLLAKKSDKRAIARVKEPDYIPLFKELGVDDIISPERRAAMDIAKNITWK
jgi:trk system potassium uptake protein TrkA